jgi:hypothetical protein
MMAFIDDTRSYGVEPICGTADRPVDVLRTVATAEDPEKRSARALRNAGTPQAVQHTINMPRAC